MCSGSGSVPGSERVRRPVSVPGGSAAQPDPWPTPGVSRSSSLQVRSGPVPRRYFSKSIVAAGSSEGKQIVKLERQGPTFYFAILLQHLSPRFPPTTVDLL